MIAKEKHYILSISTNLSLFIRQSRVDSLRRGFFMGYIMVGIIGWAAWGLSWVVLDLFWDYLSHLAGIYSLLRAISANLADVFWENYDSSLRCCIFGIPTQKSIRFSSMFRSNFHGFGLHFKTHSRPQTLVWPRSRRKSDRNWDHFPTFVRSPPQVNIFSSKFGQNITSKVPEKGASIRVRKS